MTPFAPTPRSSPRISDRSMLEIAGLSAWYGEAQALRDVSLRAAPGEIVTLVGRNGAGKTTALRCVMGLHANMRGTVRLYKLLGAEEMFRSGHRPSSCPGVGYWSDTALVHAVNFICLPGPNGSPGSPSEGGGTFVGGLPQLTLRSPRVV